MKHEWRQKKKDNGQLSVDQLPCLLLWFPSGVLRTRRASRKRSRWCRGDNGGGSRARGRQARRRNVEASCRLRKTLADPTLQCQSWGPFISDSPSALLREEAAEPTFPSYIQTHIQIKMQQNLKKKNARHIRVLIAVCTRAFLSCLCLFAGTQ